MVVLCAHDMFYGWPYINHPSCGMPSTFQVFEQQVKIHIADLIPRSQYALYLPGLALVLKAPLVLPPLSGHLARIRAGWVRPALSPPSLKAIFGRRAKLRVEGTV